MPGDPPRVLAGTALLAGDALGEVVHLREPVSFWGGVGPDGVVIDATHPDRGVSLAGRVLVMTAGRGSSSSASVLAELVHAGTGPVAVVTSVADPVLVLGALVPALLYDQRTPFVVLPDLSALVPGRRVRVLAESDGPGLVELLDVELSPRRPAPPR